jgi:hypothetical protein
MFLAWLHRLARREHGDRSTPLSHLAGADFRVGIVFVGNAAYMARKGVRPHLERADVKMYDERLDVLYVIARGKRTVDIARDGVFEELIDQRRVERAVPYEFRLRPDFPKRTGLQRSRAFVGRIEMQPWEPHERPGRRPGRQYLPMTRRWHSDSARPHPRRRRHG